MKPRHLTTADEQLADEYADRVFNELGIDLREHKDRLRRIPRVVKARQIYCYVLRQAMPDLSFSDIAQVVGYSEHTVARHSCIRVQETAELLETAEQILLDEAEPESPPCFLHLVAQQKVGLVSPESRVKQLAHLAPEQISIQTGVSDYRVRKLLDGATVKDHPAFDGICNDWAAGLRPDVIARRHQVTPEFVERVFA